MGADVAEKVRAAFNSQADSLLEPRGERFHLNLWQANRLQLEFAGVTDIEVVEVCTACHTEDWFSHCRKREDGAVWGAYRVMIARPYKR